MTKREDSEVEGREVVVEEELTFHKEKGKIVKRPSENGYTYSPIVVSPSCYLSDSSGGVIRFA
jgi:hypothetical protein